MRGFNFGILLAWSVMSYAQTPPEQWQFSLDHSFEYVSPGQQTTFINDYCAFKRDASQAVALETLCPYRSQFSDLVGVHQRADGNAWVVFNSYIETPNAYFTPQDVLLWDGSALNPVAVFDGSQEGLPSQVKIDAVSEWNGAVVLSFDTAFSWRNLDILPADVILIGPSLSVLYPAPSISLHGEVYANVDAVQVFSGQSGPELLVSFDFALNLNGIFAEDEDLLWIRNGQAIQNFIDLSIWLPNVNGLNVDAFSAEPSDPNSIFINGFE